MATVSSASLAEDSPRPHPAPPPPEQIAQRIKALPQISTASLQLAQELGAPKSDAGDLERILRGDPALATNVLRLANSAYFRGVKGAATIRDAVVRLGRRGLQSMAYGAALKSALPARLDGYGQTAQEFLRHSVAVATLSERISRRVQFVDREMIFTAGLLHDLGKLVVSTFLTDQGTVLEGLPEITQEQAMLGVDHGEVGLEVAMAWRLPHAAVLANRWHHQPMAAPDPQTRKLAGVIHLADQIDRLVFHVDATVEECLVAPEVFVRLGLRPEVMGELAAEAVAEVESICDALSA